jgi:hypothetical protein
MVNCRVWVFQGREYLEAPKAMIVDAILREVYAGQPQLAPAAVLFEDVPENLKRFFAGKTRCCEPSEKSVMLRHRNLIPLLETMVEDNG